MMPMPFFYMMYVFLRFTKERYINVMESGEGGWYIEAWKKGILGRY